MLCKPGKIRTVLIIMPDKHMGNLVISLRAIKALRDFFNDIKLCLVIDSAYAEIIEPLDWFEKVIFFPRGSIKQSRSIKRLRILMDFFMHLRSISPDISIDLDGRQASAIITLLSGASRRIGRATADFPHFYNSKVSVSENLHKVYTYLDIAASLGAVSKNTEFYMEIPECRKASLHTILASEGIHPEKPFVCIHPGSGKLYKQWTDEGFAAISGWLSSSGYQVLFVGTHNENEKINRIRSLAPGSSYSLGAKLSLGELMALFKTASLFIGNDSGPMHLAAMIGVPVIALFGSADEKRWKPLSDKAIVLREADRCNKCRGKNCEYGFKCIRSISPDTVKSAVRRLLNVKEGILQKSV